MKKDKHITINVTEIDYKYLVKKTELLKYSNLTNYCYDRLLDKTRYDTQDIKDFIKNRTLSSYVGYINYHYDLYSKLDYIALLNVLNDALQDIEKDHNIDVKAYIEYYLDKEL